MEPAGFAGGRARRATDIRSALGWRAHTCRIVRDTAMSDYVFTASRAVGTEEGIRAALGYALSIPFYIEV